jgi:hypothetical protein
MAREMQDFLEEIESFIGKVKFIEDTRNSFNCSNCFTNDDSYLKEKDLLIRIKADNFETTKEKGDSLENLVKLLFSRIVLIHSVKNTSQESIVGQVDVQLIPTDKNLLFDVLGVKKNYPDSIIGECKNYPNDPVGRPEIEKVCWRTCKAGCLSFFFAYKYTGPSLQEIAFFNNNQRVICQRCNENNLIVPVTMGLLEKVIVNDINFCYFLQWLIEMSRSMSIRNYL